jgi:CHASE2 domain-containing sensor protein
MIGGVSIFARKMKPAMVLLLVMASSILFFLVTNFAVWAASSWYPPTPEGLIASYVAGLPFLRNMFIGDLFYAASLLGAFEWAFAMLQKHASMQRIISRTC